MDALNKDNSEPAAVTDAGKNARVSALDLRLLAMIAILALVWIGFGLATNGVFLSPRNLFNLSLQVAVVGVLATGMVLVIVARHIDLSVGSQIGFIGVVGALVQTQYLAVDGSHTWWIALAAMLATGAVIGLINGALIAYVGIPSFVVTLGGLMFFRNAAYMLNEGRTISPLNETFRRIGGGLNGSIGEMLSWLCAVSAILVMVVVTLRNRQRRRQFNFPTVPAGVAMAGVSAGAMAIIVFVMVMNAYELPRTGQPAGLAIPVLILLVVGVAMSTVSRRHRFGRHVFSLGGSPQSTALSGIDTKALTLKLFVLMGLLCGLASAIVTARLNAAASVTGTMLELNVIAAAVIGGTSLSGGVGTIVGGMLGALIMQSLESGMILMGVPTPLQRMIVAMVLIMAVWIDITYRKRAKR